MNVLIIAAHPDDEVLGVGGTIARHIAEDDRVFISIAGEGIAERHGEGQGEKIKLDVKHCARVLGVPEENLSFGGFLYKERFDLSHLSSVIKFIENAIKNSSPQIVYTHHYGDGNSDHDIIFKASMQAVRPIAEGNNCIKRVLCYETLSSTDQSFSLEHTEFCPNVFVDISDYIDQKIKAFKFYKIEMKEWPHPRSIEGIRAISKYRGMIINRNAAEAFRLMREVI